MRRASMLSRILLIAVLVLAAGLATLWLGQRRLIYLPDRGTVPPAGTLLSTGRDVELTTEDGLRLGAWLVGPVPDRPDRRVAVLLAPGNAGNRLARVALARALADVGLTVLVMDYRGYGGNPGRPSEDGLVKDVRAARAELASLGWPAERIVYFGESLGCAVVSRLAVEQPPAGLVLRSPF
ncbi:MAG TPA: alpha/beta fold hydrolase, partial [Micromonosporaceae bacterium]